MDTEKANIRSQLGVNRTDICHRLAYATFAVYFLIIFARAATTFITTDEAYTYYEYVRTGDLFNLSIANNHLLLTLLIWLFSGLHDYSEMFIRLPNLLALAVVGIFLIRKSFRQLQYPLFFLAVFFCSSYLFSEYLGLARGYAISVLLNATGMIYCLDPRWQNLMKANILFLLAVFANLASFFLFAAFQPLALYWLCKQNDYRIPWSLLTKPLIISTALLNVVAMAFFYFWGSNITQRVDPLIGADSFLASVGSVEAFFPNPTIRFGLLGLLMCLLWMGFRRNDAVRDALIFLGIALLLPFLASIVNSDRSDMLLQERTWIPLWALWCFPLMAALHEKRFSRGKGAFVTTIAAVSIVFLFVKQVNLDQTAAWANNYEEASKLHSGGYAVCCFAETPYHLEFYNEKYGLPIQVCAEDSSIGQCY